MTISSQICAVIERETGQAVTPATPIESLGVDSLEFVNLLLELSNEIGGEIPDSRIPHIKTVGDIVVELV